MNPSVAARLHNRRAMQPTAVTLLSLACGLFAMSAIGCVDRDPFSAHDVDAAAAFHNEQAAAVMRRSPDPAGAGANVRCRCDAEGGLHVEAPQGSTVRVVAQQPATDEDAEAEISVPQRKAGTPIRETVSLGFIGDGKLSQSGGRGGSWNVPDNLLPAHAHGIPDRAPAGFVRVGYGGYGGYGYGGPRGYTSSYGGFGGRGSSSRGSFGGASSGGGGPSGGSSLNFGGTGGRGPSAMSGPGPSGGGARGGSASGGRGPR